MLVAEDAVQADIGIKGSVCRARLLRRNPEALVMVAKCNVPSRTMLIGDNLDILRGINSECIDPIYLDPPFNAGRRYSARSNSEARGATFLDTWSLDDMMAEWMEELEVRCPALYHFINAIRLAHGESMAGYLTFMSVRLVELRRVLRRSGSIYLHCDLSMAATEHATVAECVCIAWRIASGEPGYRTLQRRVVRWN